MKKPSDSKFAVFQPPLGLPAGLFGETYAIVTARKVGPKAYAGEYFLFTQRPKPKLTQGTLEVNAANVPADLLTVDLEFMIRECRQQADLALLDLLDKRAKDLKRPDLVTLNLSLADAPYRPFVGCWMRHAFRAQIRTVANGTGEASLKRYMSAVASMP